MKIVIFVLVAFGIGLLIFSIFRRTLDASLRKVGQERKLPPAQSEQKEKMPDRE